MKLCLRILSFFLLLILAGCFRHRMTPGPRELVIVSTNDFHSALERAEGLAFIVRDLKRKYGDKMLYVDAGDMFQGSLEGNMSKGKAIVDFFNRIPLDVAAIGNHELDYGPDIPERVQVLEGEDGIGNLKARVKQARYPWLSCNWIYDPPQDCTPGPGCNGSGRRTVFEPRTILRRAGRRVCLIGATTPETEYITQRLFIQGTHFTELAPAIQSEVSYFRKHENCDYLILVVHEGFRVNERGEYLPDRGIDPVLRELPEGLLDAVVAGHTHIPAQEIVNEMPVLEAGRGARVVGVLRLVGKKEQRVVDFQKFVQVPVSATQPDITKILRPYRQAAEIYRVKEVGTLAADFPLAHKTESALGNMVCDALLDWSRTVSRAEFCLMNAGGLRAALPEGKVSYTNVFEVMPFENVPVVTSLTGAQLRRLLEISTSGALGMPSVSGLKLKRLNTSPDDIGPWERDLDADGDKEIWERNLLLEVTDEQGNAIRDDATYFLATNSYLAMGGDYQKFVYDGIPTSQMQIFEGILIRNILARYIENHPQLNPADYYSEAYPRIRLTSY